MTSGQPPPITIFYMHALLNTSVTQLTGTTVRTQLYRGFLEILTVRIEPILSGSHSNT